MFLDDMGQCLNKQVFQECEDLQFKYEQTFPKKCVSLLL